MNKEAYESLTGAHLIEGRDNWKSLCPMHDEKTPSFFIHKETFACHCFGCGVSGYLEHVLSRALDKSEREIRVQLDIPLLKVTKELVVGSTAPLKETDRFSSAWLSAFRLLQSHPYLVKRGFGEEITIAHEARLDTKDKRIVFTLMNLEGEIVGATGRTLIDEYPKWKFYWNVAKGNVIYYCPSPYLHDFKVKHVIVVEGIFDAMWLNQLGYKNVVAILGSSPSKKQVELIKSIADRVTLFLDNDESGLRGQEYLRKALKSSVEIMYAIYPTKDPCDPNMLSKEQIENSLVEKTHVEYVHTHR